MKMRAVLAGVLFGVSAMVSVACGSDDKTLVKWSCACQDACAATEGDAKSLTTYCSETNVCTTTGDICACPDGASKCEIIFK